MSTFPMGPEHARLCIHANKVWFGTDCALCEQDEGYIWQDEVGPSNWVYIERDAQDVYIGPFYGENANEDAARCMDESLLVDHLLQREGGGGTDCYVTIDQPESPRDDVYIIDQHDPHHTGKGEASL